MFAIDEHDQKNVSLQAKISSGEKWVIIKAPKVDTDQMSLLKFEQHDVHLLRGWNNFQFADNVPANAFPFVF